MGPSINGLDSLIKMPYGCGEQNMVNFAPTIFVTEYLTQLNRLTEELKTKSIAFMEKGLIVYLNSCISKNLLIAASLAE